jgi:hypothetical protein
MKFGLRLQNSPPSAQKSEGGIRVARRAPTMLGLSEKEIEELRVAVSFRWRCFAHVRPEGWRACHPAPLAGKGGKSSSTSRIDPLGKLIDDEVSFAFDLDEPVRPAHKFRSQLCGLTTDTRVGGAPNIEGGD